MLWLILACIGLLCMPLIAGFVYGLWEKRDRIREIRRANRESKKLVEQQTPKMSSLGVLGGKAPQCESVPHAAEKRVKSP